ncbi:uridine kinase [Amnibacterium kyonggiense]|uniref:Uridine kinase n=1 Tax=Amnibacterium kyonggiense TaxID=595671 RepID=A0A4V3EAV4_9MICO|nr:uridine kinase [Amnibacterium kyonggiense]TDS77454.1 uridine kinase [Amnibacterium kyonggiense]
MERDAVLERIAERLLGRRLDHPLRVGVDGVCGAGKTTFAHALAEAVRDAGGTAIEVDSDGFHHVRARRYRQGRDSARGYYEDAYDLDGLRDLVLRPLGPGGDRRYAEHLHDLETDEVAPRFAVAAPDAVVVLGCTFLQRGTLREDWDEVVWLEVPEGVATARGVARDAAALGGESAAEAAYASRYAAARRMYVEEEAPRDRASIVVDDTDPAAPLLIRA